MKKLSSLQYYRTSTIIGLLLLSSFCYSADWSATLDRVVDGDTVVVTIDLGFEVKLGNQFVRLLGVDTPERYKEGGPEATSYTTAWFETCREGWVFVSDGDRGKYGRILGDFACGANKADSLVQSLITAGHVKEKATEAAEDGG